MASDREWSTGYYMQARADMRAARVLQGQEPSVLGMLLQMALEKLANAALLRRSRMILDAFKEVRGEREALNVTVSMGLTPPEAQRMGIG